MHFDLQALIHHVQYLNWLEEPFTMEEIDVVIANVPTNKSLGPNGFNSDIMNYAFRPSRTNTPCPVSKLARRTLHNGRNRCCHSQCANK
jgi:hypothetical protein